eukprot:gene3191-4037_t
MALVRSFEDGGFDWCSECVEDIDIRQFILSHLGWEPGVVYHDYASLVGHPLSEVVMGDDGITRQLNSNWNVYFANYALAASPVMLFIVTEAWWLSPWCALEQRQRTEVKQAKQAPEGLRGYYRTDHSDPAAGIAGDISTAGYQQRHRQLEDELEAQRMEWRRADRDFGDLSEGVFRAVAFGNKRDEVYLFTEDPGGPEANATPFALADLDALRAKEWADRKFEARLNQLHEKAISDGLRFETGPCPF